MRRHLLGVAAAIGGAVLVAPTVELAAARAASAPPAANAAVERGRHLVTIMGCHDCHTPKKLGPNGPEPDLSRALSGHPEGDPLPAPPAPKGPWVATATWDLTAWSGPWGISYPVNLTPDENTGLGIWTEEMFVQAMRTGRHMGVSRPILPPMPWQMVGKLDNSDLKAVFAYLRSLPPVKNRVPEAMIAEAPASGR